MSTHHRGPLAAGLIMAMPGLWVMPRLAAASPDADGTEPTAARADAGVPPIAAQDQGGALVLRLSTETAGTEFSALEMTVQKEPPGSREPFIAQVFASFPDAAGATTGPAAPVAIGSFSYFAPEPAGQSSRFVLPLPANWRRLVGGRTVRIEVRLLPVVPGTRLRESGLRLLAARLIP